MRDSRRGESAFTLVEMVVFIVVAGIFVPLAYIVFSTSMKDSTKPEAIGIARHIAEQKVDSLMSLPYADAGLNPTNTTYIDVDPTLYPGYKWKWTIAWLGYSGTRPNLTLNNSSSDLGYKKIMVYVKEPGGYEYTVWTLYTNKQLKVAAP